MASRGTGGWQFFFICSRPLKCGFWILCVRILPNGNIVEPFCGTSLSGIGRLKMSRGELKMSRREFKLSRRQCIFTWRELKMNRGELKMSRRELKMSRRELKMNRRQWIFTWRDLKISSSSLVTSKVSFPYLAIKCCNYFINLGCRTVKNILVAFQQKISCSRSVAVVFSVVVNLRVACSCAVFRSLLR